MPPWDVDHAMLVGNVAALTTVLTFRTVSIDKTQTLVRAYQHQQLLIHTTRHAVLGTSL